MAIQSPSKPLGIWPVGIGDDPIQIDRVVYAPNILRADECARCLSHLEAACWTPAEVETGITWLDDGAHAHRKRRAEVTLISRPSRCRERLLMSVRRDALPIARERLRYIGDCVGEPYAVRYGPGGFYRLHRDSGPRCRHRRVTILWYLDDEFVGGETSFPEIGIAVRPVAGAMLLFPSSYVHAAEPIISGSKTIVTCTLDANPLVRDWI